jgi:N-acetylglucosamine-6-phosphate deacetylase
MAMRTILKNGKVITPVRVLENGGVVIDDGKVTGVFRGNDVATEPQDRIIDVQGKYISPGFIDIHVHGGGGYDIMTGTPEAVRGLTLAHMDKGTTSIVPTTTTSTIDELYATLDSLGKVKREMKDGPNILGIHLEGPYFSMEERGAQDPRNLKTPTKEEYLEILDHSSDIIRWTVAPELEGALEMGRLLTQRGILCSIGHSSAIYEDVLKAFENGYTHVTHLYSGTSMVRRINAFRYAGIVESAYLIDEMTVEIIADGVHLPESLLKLIYKIKGPDKICLVTDAVMAAGMPEGEYTRKDGRKIIVEDSVAKLLDRTSFAGSVATTDRLVRTMVQKAGVPLQQAIRMMTLTPARVIGCADRKGSIASGKDADIVVFDDNINVSLVMVAGEIRVNRLDNTGN